MPDENDDLTYEDLDESKEKREDDFESEANVEEALENDEISSAEAGFQEGVDRDQ